MGDCLNSWPCTIEASIYLMLGLVALGHLVQTVLELWRGRR